MRKGKLRKQAAPGFQPAGTETARQDASSLKQRQRLLLAARTIFGLSPLVSLRVAKASHESGTGWTRFIELSQMFNVST